MANYYTKEDGQWLKFSSSAHFESKYGYKPDEPRGGEKLFGGRYEHLTFNSSSFNKDTGFPTNPSAEVNTGSTSFAGLEAGSGSV